MNREYAEKVEILLRLLPVVMDEKVFAVHGGSAINLFIKNLPRYSVDIDLTYIPLEGRDESLEHINSHLMNITDKAERAFRGIHIVPKMSTSKLLCEYQGKQVKVEVNQTKRGIIGHNVQPSIMKIKASAEQAKYLESLPLHPSQTPIEVTSEYTVFRYRLVPTFDLKQEILSRGSTLEVLSPEWFREEIVDELNEAVLNYRYN